MGIIMGTTTTINHHKATTQSCPRSSLSGHEKAMLSYNGSMAFFISVWGAPLFLITVLPSPSLVNVPPNSREYTSGYPIRNRGRRYPFGLDSAHFHSHIVDRLELLWLPTDSPERCSGSIL